MLSWALTIFNAYRVHIVAAGAVFLVLAGWHAHKLVIDAESADRLRNAINTRIQAEQFRFKQGMNLETGLNDYRTKAKELDRSVKDAITTTSPRFDAGSMQRTANRIAAGEAARKRSY